MEIEENKKKFEWPSLVLLMILSIFFLFIIGLMIDSIYNNSFYYNKIVYGSNCQFQTPSGYTIFYSELRKKYAVKVLLHEDYYLYNGKYGITAMYSSIAEPSLFEDSCVAKAYLKAYIEDQKPKFK